MDTAALLRLITGALEARAAASRHPFDEVIVGYWTGYRDAFAAATGHTPAEAEAMIDRHA